MLQNATSVELAGSLTNPSIYRLSSPVSRALIISELLRTIFLFCVAEDGEEPKYTNPRPWSLNLSKRSRRKYPLISEKDAPLLLAHICRSWRRTALDTPQLWACLHIHLPEYISTKPWFPSPHKISLIVERRLSALKFWLKKSRNCPISVYFTVGWRVEYGSRIWYDRESESRTLPSEEPVAAEFAQELLKHSHRWENIFLSLPRVDLLPFYDNLNRNFPLLEHFELDKSNAKDGRGLVARRDLSIHSTPRMKGWALSGNTSADYVIVPDGLPATLQALELTYMRMRFTQSVNGCQLRVLVLFEVPLFENDFSKFPSVFPLLEELTLKNCVCVDVELGHGIDPANLVVLDKLTSLRLSSPSIGECFPLLWMTAPALRHLIIKGLKYVERRESAEHADRSFEYTISVFLSHSGALVETFEYSRSTQKSNTIISMLNAMPRLVMLTYKGVALPSATIKDLSNPAYCPRLRSIRNEGHLPKGDGFASLYRTSVDDFSKLIERRCLSRRDLELVGGRDRERYVGSYIREIAFPLHEAQETLLRTTPAFKEAEVRWSNTHRCGRKCPGFEKKKKS